MSLTVTCPSCTRGFLVPGDQAGAKVKCPRCTWKFTANPPAEPSIDFSTARLELSVGRIETDSGVIDCKCYVTAGREASLHLYTNDGRKSGVYLILNPIELEQLALAIDRAKEVFTLAKEKK